MSGNSAKYNDLEAISTYLDGEMLPETKQIFEARLREEKELAGLYEKINWTRTLLRSQPILPAPRNYTLQPDTIKQKTNLWKMLLQGSWIFQGATGLLSLVFGVWFCINLFTYNQMGNVPMAAAPAPAVESAPMLAAPPSEVQQNGQNIITENTPTDEPMLKIAPLNTPTGATPYPMLSQETSIGAGEISATQTITVPLMKTFLESTSVALDLEQTITTTPPIPEEAYPAAPQASQLDYGQSARSLYPAPEETSTQIFPSNTQRIIFQGSLAFLAIFFGGFTFYLYKHKGKS